jgi:hypothetical protein
MLLCFLSLMLSFLRQKQNIMWKWKRPDYRGTLLILQTLAGMMAAGPIVDCQSCAVI